jgi:hypothetical protein
MDVNADLQIDLFGSKYIDSNSSVSQRRTYWLNNGGNFEEVEAMKDHQPRLFNISIPNSNAFVDVNGDCAADLIVVSKGPCSNSSKRSNKGEKEDEGEKKERILNLLCFSSKEPNQCNTSIEIWLNNLSDREPYFRLHQIIQRSGFPQQLTFSDFSKILCNSGSLCFVVPFNIYHQLCFHSISTIICCVSIQYLHMVFPFNIYNHLCCII